VISFNLGIFKNMAETFIPNLKLNSTNNNSVVSNIITGAISNAITQISATSNTFGTSSFASGATLTLAATNSFPASSTINFTNATASNLTLAGANGNSVDNASLPATITRDVNNSAVTTTDLAGTNATLSYITYGNPGTGGQMKIDSKCFPGPAVSNASGTIGSIIGFPTSEEYAWSITISVIGASPGTVSEGNSVFAEWIVTKVLTIATPTVRIFTKMLSASNASLLAVPSLDVSQLFDAATISINQEAASSNDGVPVWTISFSYTTLNSTVGSPVLA
jgi:hypothetical protein